MRTMDAEWINWADNISKLLSTFEKVWLELIIIVIR